MASPGQKKAVCEKTRTVLMDRFSALSHQPYSFKQNMAFRLPALGDPAA